MNEYPHTQMPNAQKIKKKIVSYCLRILKLIKIVKCLRYSRIQFFLFKKTGF